MQRIDETQSKLDELLEQQTKIDAKIATLKNRPLSLSEKHLLENLQSQSNEISNQIDTVIQLQTSNHVISAKLQQHPASARTPRKAYAKEISREDFEKINRRFNELPPELQKVLAAALSDDHISLEFIHKPVFIRGEGHLYDLSVVNDLLASKKEAHCPINRDQVFTANDVIPCNVLIDTMIQIVNIISGQAFKSSSLKQNDLVGQQIQKRARIPANHIPLIEAYYKTLKPQHQALFDLICRDPASNLIMDDPVLLPDGYAYDRTTVEFILTLAERDNERALCPHSDHLTFTRADITPCHFIVKILDQLKENMDEQLNAQRGNQNQELRGRKTF